MKELTIRILKSCFSNQFGMGCSWLGLRGNLAVSKLKITKSIKGKKLLVLFIIILSGH